MIIQSKPYGEIEIDESKVIDMIDGLFGFEDKERFAIIGREDEQPFEWFQSLEDPSLAFVICQAQAIKPDYELSIVQEDYDDIGVENDEEIVVYLIVNVPENPDEMTVNFRGPIVINQSNFKGKQVINQVEEYDVKHRLLDELENNSTLEATGEI